MKKAKNVLSALILLIFIGVNSVLSVYGNQSPHKADQTNSLNMEDFWKEDVKQFESVHDHSDPHGGQVGMAGSLHIEFVAREDGEYKIYITGYERKPVDVSKATGFLIINPESSESEKLILSVDKILQDFLWAKGKPHKQGETITASMEVEIPGQEKIIQSFYIKISRASTDHKMGHEEKK